MKLSYSQYRGRRVLLTGHTGFKGSWLALWLQTMGAKVYGYALQPPTSPNLFTIASVEQGMTGSEIADIRDANRLSQFIEAAQPEVVFHLAAQPLVRQSYMNPVETYSTNVMGTVHLLEAVRQTPSVRAVVIVTSDKCYENKEWLWGYRENEAMGGFDPYSSSKGCAELVTSAYRNSFFHPESPQRQGVALASARSGNVIGGGDWAADRLIPDFLRAADSGQALHLRSPDAIRPWQHVLEPLSGYLLLAEHLYSSGQAYAEAWNFGPYDADARPVSWIVEQMSRMEMNIRWQYDKAHQPHEANYLKLDSSKARSRLGWHPRWDLHAALQATLEWHRHWHDGSDMRAVTLRQINRYQGGME